MKTIATLGPEKSHGWLAASRYAPDARIQLYSSTGALLDAYEAGEADLAVIPVYNTREGENKEYFHHFDKMRGIYWIDNIVLPSNLSLGVFKPGIKRRDLRFLMAKRTVFKQCEEYIGEHFADRELLSVYDIDRAIEEARENDALDRGVIDSEEMLLARNMHIIEREVAPYNRTRFAVLGRELPGKTGYDSTVLMTRPLEDRVGLLVDMLSEFSRRGINLLDMRAENDIKTQKLRVYIEAEGHRRDQPLREVISHIEESIIRQSGGIRVLGSFPRIDMRARYIQSIGFIGTGAMSSWFADRLIGDGYRVMLCGRSTELRPEEMISQVDVVMICVPISATNSTIKQYGPLLKPGQGLVLLAGESETTLQTALDSTDKGVELMLVHNLWGPQAANMKDKNAIVVRSERSGKFCSEVEGFLYKHGANIYHDSPSKHDLLMGMGQKLPTVMSVALAMTLKHNNITKDDITSHSTLTSLYPILAMARIHSQNPRTYAEIMSISGEGRKLVHDFLDNLKQVVGMADKAMIEELCALIDDNGRHLTKEFLEARMSQAKAVDEVLGRTI